MAKKNVDSIIKALKSELEFQETLKMIDNACKDIPIRRATESNAYPIDKYNEVFHDELITAISILEGAMSESNDGGEPQTDGLLKLKD
jgi:hypothetical protein